MASGCTAEHSPRRRQRNNSVHARSINEGIWVEVVREDCGQEAGAGFGQALREGISAIGDVAAGVVEAFPVASTVVQGISAVAGPILDLFGIKEECDPVTLGERATECITNGTSETRSTEEEEAYTRAKRSTTTDVKRLAENVGRGETISCAVTAPQGVTLWQLYLHTPAADTVNSVNSRLCIFCMTWGDVPKDPPGVAYCGSRQAQIFPGSSTASPSQAQRPGQVAVNGSRRYRGGTTLALSAWLFLQVWL